MEPTLSFFFYSFVQLACFVYMESYEYAYLVFFVVLILANSSSFSLLAA